jgi:hypothetical protein
MGTLVPPDLVLVVLKGTSKFTPELEGGLVRLVAKAGVATARTTLQGAPAASLEAFLVLVKSLPDDAIATLAKSAGTLDRLAALPARSLGAFADIARGLPASALEKAATSPADFVAAVEAADAVVDHLGVEHARGMYGEKLPKKAGVAGGWGRTLKTAPEFVAPQPVRHGSWILDSNANAALIHDAAGTGTPRHAAVAAHLRNLGVSDIRVAAATIAEVGPSAGVARGTFPLTVSRSHPDYQAVLALVRTEIKGAGDQAIAADLFFAQTEAGVTPKFFTSDRGFANGMARLAGMSPATLGASVASTFPGGFSVTLAGRTIQVYTF